MSRPDLKENEYVSSLWIIAVDGSAPPRRLTHGRHDAAPRLSPDGRWVAFLRAEAEGKPQLHVLPVAGGDARRLTELHLGAGVAAWSPDSTRIAFSARVAEAGRYGLEEKASPEKEAPRRITGLRYRLDDVGFVADRRLHVHVVDLPEGDAEPEVRQLTDGDWDDSDPVWSPDGARIAFTSARHETRERDRAEDVFVISPDGGAPTRLSDSSLALAAPAFSPDGRSVLALGIEVADGKLVARNSGLWTMDVAATGRPHRLTDAETRHLVSERIIATPAAALVLAENRGAVELLAVPYDGSEPRVVVAGQRVVLGADAIGETVVVSYGDGQRYAELGVVRSADVSRLTDFSRELAPLPISEFEATAPDGHRLHGFVVEPEGSGPHPVLLMIHGGPFTQYTWRIFDEAQVYAGAGYAVVYTNPRGSSGYGESYGAHIRGDVGSRSAADLLALLDAALQRPSLDGSRVGVLGGSHGGFMTSWLIGNTDRFRAAVSERAVNAIDSFEGSSDIGYKFADDLYGTDPEARYRQSPLSHADNITAPLLIIHSEHDWRCPIEQAQRLYVALRRRDAPVEMLLFPGEGHELSRSGLPSHRLARFDAIVDWFDRHLK
ncbi:MAG TPA: S9 family peptidase [Jatrophihabitans sp.]|nr:S9 family peptidase [Jatrophihabitans sp.]